MEYLPPQMHLVIATREDPPLPLSRLRAGSIALNISELKDILPFTLNAGLDFFDLFLVLSNGKKHDRISVNLQVKNSSSNMAHRA